MTRTDTTPVVVSLHKTRFNARRQARRVKEAVDVWQAVDPQTREEAYSRSMDLLDLTRRLPRWARVFKAERAKRTPFAWCVRAYPPIQSHPE